MVLPLTVPVSIASMKTGEFIRDNLPAAVSRDTLDDYKAVDRQLATNNIVSCQNVFAPFWLKIMGGLR